MKRAFRTSSAVLLAAVLAASGCSSGRNDEIATQEQFGVRMARMNLWREALFRFRRAVQMNPTDAMARNNLAVAYEANGDFENALKEYREAIRLDRSNQYIQKNYSRFVEFTSRNRKRQQRNTAARTAAAAEAAQTPAASSPPPAPASPEPAAAPPVEAPGATAVPGSVTSPSPVSSAPAATPPPNPQPEPPPPAPPATDPPKPQRDLP